jgi:hypothetical protein
MACIAHFDDISCFGISATKAMDSALALLVIQPMPAAGVLLCSNNVYNNTGVASFTNVT